MKGLFITFEININFKLKALKVELKREGHDH
jgi:hypothetical protein